MGGSDAALGAALEFMGARRFHEAIALLANAERRATTDPDPSDRIRLLRHMGICHFELGNMGEAESCFRECLDQANRIDSDLERINAHHELSLIYYRSQNLDKAIESATEAVRILNLTGDN